MQILPDLIEMLKSSLSKRYWKDRQLHATYVDIAKLNRQKRTIAAIQFSDREFLPCEMICHRKNPTYLKEN
jgi:disulfide oxidoreductase YuzD